MALETVDVEMVVLSAIASDRYLLEKLLDEGFHPQLLHSGSARLIAETLAALREQSINAIDPIIVKAKLQERGLFSPQVQQYMEAMGRIRLPQLDQLLSYLDLLKDRQARQRLLKLGASLEGDRQMLKLAPRCQRQLQRPRLIPAPACDNSSGCLECEWEFHSAKLRPSVAG